MTRIKFIISFALTGMLAHQPVAGAEFHYNRNVELIGIVYNTATGYRTENDGVTLADTAIFRKPYAMFGERVAHHPAVLVMKQMLEENEPTGFRTMIIPTIHLEPYVGYGALMTEHSGDRVAVSMYGLSLGRDDEDAVFNLAPGMFAHETLHAYVTQAMDSPAHKEQARILQNIFPRFEAAAIATGDYSDWSSYFNETITMAAEMTMNGYVGERYKNFTLLKPAIEILKREFVGSQLSFFDFYPTLIAELAFVNIE